ncbi:unnamed protein product [Malus baccata var. baccata]
MLQSTPFKGPTSSSAHIQPWIGSDTKLSHFGPSPHHITEKKTIRAWSGPKANNIVLRGPTSSSAYIRPGLALIPNCHIPACVPTTSLARLHRSTILSSLSPDHTLTVLFLGTHMRTSQWLPKGLVLGRDGNIHIRLTGSTPLGDVGCYMSYSARLLLTPWD